MDKTLTEQEIALLRRKLDLLLRTGQLLVESAADTNRVVRNLNRVAAYLGLPEEKLHIDVSYTMLVVNVSDGLHSFSKFQKCEKHGINMTAISVVTGWRFCLPLSALLPASASVPVAWSSASITI